MGIAAETDFTFEGIADLADELLSQWHASRGEEFNLKKRKNRRTTVAQFAVVYGLATHVHELAEATLPLLRDRKTNVATPLVRSIYECSLTAHWVAQAEEGAEAFMNEDVRQRVNLKETALKAASATFRDGASSIAGLDAALPRTPDDESARRFDFMCNDLRPGGPDAYVYYRLLSARTHPSNMLVDQYLEMKDEQLTLRTTSREEGPEMWAFFTAVGMVWAGRALNYLEDDRARRSYLRGAARRLGVEAELKLSDTYHLRRIRQKAAGSR